VVFEAAYQSWTKDPEQLLFVVQELAEGHLLAERYNDHPLKGQYIGKRDCHIDPDWILIYAVEQRKPARLAAKEELDK